MAQFDKFTDHARKAIHIASEEATRLNHNYIGTEHLLLGLVREGDGVAARVLNNMGVRLPKIRSAVEFIIGRGEGAVIGDVGLTPRAKMALELAVDEGRRLNHHYIGTEHLLLGMLREGESIAAGVLESLGVNLEKARRNVMRVVSDPKGPLLESGAIDRQEPRQLYLDELHPRVFRVLAIAYEEAIRQSLSTIQPEHLLLGVLREDGPAAALLKREGLRLTKLRNAIVQTSMPGDSTEAHDPDALSREALDCVAKWLSVSNGPGLTPFPPERLLIGLCLESRCGALLESSGLDPYMIAAEARDLSRSAPPTAPPSE